MQQYHNLLSDILVNGIQQANRTGIDTLMVPGRSMAFDLREGFPAVTTKKLAFNQVKGELVGFVRGCTNVKDFQKLGCNVWNQNATSDYWLNNPNNLGDGDLGCIYGALWRRWPNNDGITYTDQLHNVIKTIINNPTDRRMIISAWRPDMFDRMALPPCHVSYQFIADSKNKVLHLCMYQRSCDMFLGVPFNIASASLLLEIVSKLTGYTAGVFTHFLADAHIYVNHVPQVQEMLTRTPLALPSIKVDVVKLISGSDLDMLNIDHDIDKALLDIEPEDIHLVGYDSHPAIKADMAV